MPISALLQTLFNYEKTRLKRSRCSSVRGASSWSHTEAAEAQSTWYQRFMRGLDSIPTGGNILSLDILFSRSKASDAKISNICS